MNSTPSLLDKLRDKVDSVRGNDLPDIIRYRDLHQNPIAKPLLEATLDEIAFVIDAIDQETLTLSMRKQTLDRLYRLARRIGGFGAQRVGDLVAQMVE